MRRRGILGPEDELGCRIIDTDGSIVVKSVSSLLPTSALMEVGLPRVPTPSYLLNVGVPMLEQEEQVPVPWVSVP